MNLLLAVFLVTALPDTLHLTQAYREAEAHYPRRQELALHDAMADLRLRNLDARYLPSLALNGQASYQSDVIELPLEVPGLSLPQIPKDQYKTALSVDQLVYDGGLTSQQKTLEAIQRDLAQQEIVVAMYGLREQVNAAFFGVLLSQAQAASLSTLEEDLRARLNQVESRVREGVILGSSADVLAVELLKVEQQQAEVEANRRAGLAVLETLLGRPVPEDEVLARPEVAIPATEQPARERPEYEVFNLNQQRLAAQQKLEARKKRPQVFGFAEAAFGRPQGTDFFDDAFGPFYSFGVRVRWPFWEWQTSRREREVLSLQREAVEAQEATFTQRLEVAAEQQRGAIARIQAVLARDDEIIARREAITAQAASQLNNGVITATDYLAERNAEHQARLTQALHRLQLVQAQVQYLTILGETP